MNKKEFIKKYAFDFVKFSGCGNTLNVDNKLYDTIGHEIVGMRKSFRLFGNSIPEYISRDIVSEIIEEIEELLENK